jgi:hypothetical protein
VFLTKVIAKKINNSTIRVLVGLIFCITLFLSPVMDEIIGGNQFRGICRTNVDLVFEPEEVRGKTVIWSGYKKRKIQNTILEITEKVVKWQEVDSDKVLIKDISYSAKGGWLSRAIAFNNITTPYTFKGNCSPHNEFKELKKTLNIQIKYK